MKVIATIVALAAVLTVPATASDSDQRLAESLVPLIRECMVLPKDAEVRGATAVIEIELQNGQLVGDPRVVKQPQTQDDRNMLHAALRAVKRCGPYPSNISMTIQVGFDPSE